MPGQRNQLLEGSMSMNTGSIRRLLAVAGATSLVAVLVGSSAMASSGTPASRVSGLSHALTVEAAAPPPTDTDNLQEGDQTTSDTGADAIGAADPAGDPNAGGPDPAGSETEDTADDTPGATNAVGTTTLTSLKSAAVKNPKKTALGPAKPAVVKHAKAPSVKTADPAGDPTAEGPDTGTETEASGETSNETDNDGPGGLADPTGQDGQHEFQGVE